MKAALRLDRMVRKLVAVRIVKVPWRKILWTSAQKAAGMGLFVLLAYVSKATWLFIYNTDNQFGHIIVSVIVGCVWIVYAILSVVVGFVLVSKD